MGLVSNIIPNKGIERPSGQYSVIGERVNLLSKAGETVDKETALTIGAFYRATSLLAGSFAKAPLKVFKGYGDEEEENTKHWSAKLLRGKPNCFQNMKQFLRHMFVHTFTGGNSYAYIERDNLQRISQIIPMDPRRVSVYIAPEPTYEVMYGFRPMTGPELFFNAEDIIHWPSILSLNGITGLSLVECASQTLGLSLAEISRASAQLKNSASPGGVLKYPNRLTDKQYTEIKKSAQDWHGGSKNAGNILILHNGMEFQAVGMSNKDLELIAERKFSVVDVSLFTGIPLSFLGQESSTSYNSAEQQNLIFLQYTLEPWMDDFEAILNDKLFMFQDRDTYHVGFDYDVLNRIDSKTRSEADEKGRQGGWLNADDIRRRRKMKPIGGVEGSTYWRPVNMVPADTPVAQKPEVAPPPTEPPKLDNNSGLELRSIGEKALKPLFYDAFDRVSVQIAMKAGQVLRKSTEKSEISAKMQEFFKEKRATFASILLPVVASCADFSRINNTPATALEIEKRSDTMAGDVINLFLAACERREMEYTLPREHIDGQLNTLFDYFGGLK